MAANSRDPYRQRHVQTEITRDIEMIGSGGKTSGKFLKICILPGEPEKGSTFENSQHQDNLTDLNHSNSS